MTTTPGAPPSLASLAEVYAAVLLSVPFENAVVLKQLQFSPSIAFKQRLSAAASSDAAHFSSDSPRSNHPSPDGDDTAANDSDFDPHDRNADEGEDDDDDDDDDDRAAADSATEIPTDDDLDDTKSFQDLDDLTASLDKRAKAQHRRHHRRHHAAADGDPYSQPLADGTHGVTASTAAADASGYLLRTTYDDNDPTRPPYQLPSILHTSVSGILGRIASHNDEGLASLWKGHMACLWKTLAFSWVQSTVSESLASSANIDIVNEPLKDAERPYATAALMLAGHAIAGIVCGPLELVQTRLIVQTSRRGRRKYRSTWHALTTVISEEHSGNSLGILFSPQLVLPAVIHTVLEAIFRDVAGPLLIDRWLGIAHAERPLTYLMCELGLGAIELAVLLPIETIRRRLMCQVVCRTPRRQPGSSRHNDIREFQTVVGVSPTPYAGIWDCLYRVVTEEGGSSIDDRDTAHTNHRSSSSHRHRNRRRSEPRHSFSSRHDPYTDTTTPASSKHPHHHHTPSWSISSLYRGYGARLFARVLIALVRAAVESIEIIDAD